MGNLPSHRPVVVQRLHMELPHWTKEKKKKTGFSLTANGSACSQDIGAPHDAGLIFSGSDSGTATRMKQISSKAMAVAKITTNVSP